MRSLAFALALLPLAATAAPSTVIYRHSQDVRPSFVAGDLAGPTTLAPEAAARAFLRTAPELAPVPMDLLGAANVRHLDGATIVRFDLTHAGLPVVDTQVIVRLDARGRVRLVAGRPLSLEQVGPATPTLGADEAQDLLARTHAPWQADAVRAVTPRLVWQPTPGGSLQLVWELRLPAVPVLMQQLLFRVDAHTGALVAARNLVRFTDQGKVFIVDPDTDGTTTVQTLADRAPGTSDPPDALTSELVKIVNCVDKHNTVPINYGGFNVNVHVCDEVSTVVHDGTGDYLQYDPVLTAYAPVASATEDATSCLTNPGCDPFAEVNAYWHIQKAYKYFQAFNDPNFVHEPTSAYPLQVNVNYRFPIDFASGFDIANATNAQGKLFGADNSMFLEGQLIPGLNRPPSVMLFEGSRHDVSYDATVAYHEFTHSVLWSMNAVWAQFQPDEQGLDPAPIGQNEGFSDTFASFLSGLHISAGYALGFIPDAPRDLKNTHLVCPDLLWGESHQDGQAMSEALWKIHDTLGADSEKPIFAGVATLPVDASFAETVAAVESALEDQLGTAAKSTAHDIFLDHGVVACQRVINYTQPREILFTLGTSEAGITPVPGYLQFKYTLPVRAQSLHAQFGYSASAMSSMTGGGTPGFTVYVRKDQPITWTYGVTGTTATGTRDYDFALTGTNNNALFSADFTQLLEPGDYYLMIVSTGTVGGQLSSVAFSHVAAPQDDAGPPPQDDAGTGGDDAGGGGGGRKGCDCRTGGTPANAGLLALLGLALLLARRRR
jgi:MYXO-CTERM domain-containing protein